MIQDYNENNEENRKDGSKGLGEKPKVPIILMGGRVKIKSEVDKDKKMLDDDQVLSLWQALFNTFVYFDVDNSKELFAEDGESISICDLTSESRFVENYQYLEQCFEADNKKVQLVYIPISAKVIDHIVTGLETRVLFFENIFTDKENKYTKIDLDVIKKELEKIIQNNYSDDVWGATYGKEYIDSVYKSIQDFEVTKYLSYDDVGMLKIVAGSNFLYPFFIKKSDLTGVKRHFIDYIKRYTRGELNKAIDGGSYLVRDNLVRYEFAKKAIFSAIRNSGYIEKYGDEFVWLSDDIKELVGNGIPVFHTLLAMEMEGLIEIMRMRISYWGKYVNEAREYDIFIKIHNTNAILEGNNQAIIVPVLSLEGKVVTFDSIEAKISVEGKNCQLPPYKNEHSLCTAMFEYRKGEAVDWSEVFEKMSGFTRTPTGRNTKNDTRSVQDAVYAVNTRVRETFHTEDDLFSWQSKSVIRNF